MKQSIWKTFCDKYQELEETCYRTSVAGRAERGRFRGRYKLPTPLVKKLDLDLALAELYERFFGQI